jgi:hypothetical protein
MPKEEGAYRRFAAMVGELAAHKGRIEYYRDIFNQEKEDVIKALKSFAHGLSLDRAIFYDCTSGECYNASAMFDRFFRCNGNSIDYSDSMRKNTKAMFKGLTLTLRGSDELSKIAKSSAFAFTGIDVFYSQSLNVTEFLRTKQVKNGTLTPPTMLPFKNIASEVSTSSYANRFAISAAVQELSGLIPVEFSDKSNFTRSFLSYESITYVPSEDDWSPQDATFIAPITIAKDGSPGDCATNDILSTTPPEPLDYDPTFTSISHKKMGYLDKFEPGHWANQNRPLTSNVSYTDLSESQEAGLWSTIRESSSRSVQVGPYRFVKFKYSTIQYDEFIQTKPLACMVDFGIMSKLSKDGRAVSKQYQFFLVCGFSRKVLAIKTASLLHKETFQKQIQENPLTDHPRYIRVFKGLLLTYPVASSLVYASVLSLAYKNGGIIDDISPDLVIQTAQKALTKMGKGSAIPSMNRLATIAIRLLIQQLSDRGFCFLEPQKADSTSANEALKYLSENAEGFHVYDDFSDESVDEEEIVYNFDSPLNFSPAVPSNTQDSGGLDPHVASSFEEPDNDDDT